jgi:hypothetical protein
MLDMDFREFLPSTHFVNKGKSEGRPAKAFSPSSAFHTSGLGSNLPVPEASAADRTRCQRPEAHHQKGRL